jgi:cytochrome c-type biogenesis protein CcmH
MIVFVSIAAALLAAALGFTILPLLRRKPAVPRGDAADLSLYQDQLAELSADLASGMISGERFAEANQELQRRVLEEHAPRGSARAVSARSSSRWRVPAMIALILPLAVVALYWRLGSPQAFAPRQSERVDPAAISPEYFRTLTQKLANHVKKNPNDPRAWTMLAQSYQALGRSGDAAQALARALAAAPDDPDVIADYAGALAAAQNNNLQGKPAQLVGRALEIDPKNQRALALAGAAAFQRKQYQAAADYWQRLLGQLPESSDAARDLRANIAEAQAAQSKGDLQTAIGSATVGGTVSLSPNLTSKAKPDDALFIFARPVGGAKMPLAVVRGQVKDLPKTFSLDDTMAMTPMMRLSNFTEVTIEARISKSGAAMPQSGDLQGSSGTVKIGANGLNIVIDKVVP